MITDTPRYAGLTIEEKVEKLWDDIAHVYAVDADNPKDVEKFQRTEARYAGKAGQPSWRLNQFNLEYNEYNKLKGMLGGAK